MIKNKLSHLDKGRQLLQKIFTSDADIFPDYLNKTLTIKLHNLNYKKDDKVMQYLNEKLNEKCYRETLALGNTFFCDIFCIRFTVVTFV